MNFSVIFGFLMAIGMISFFVFQSAQGMDLYINSEAIVVVLGGTLAASLLIFPFKKFIIMFKVFWNKVIFNRKTKAEDVIKEILFLAKGYRKQNDFLKVSASKIKEPFLKESIDLLNRGGISIEEIEEILHKRLSVQNEKYAEEAEIFKILSKFPPAFGLMGTTLGMINLMRSLGTEDSFKLIGPAMGIALVATLYGIGVANLVLIPFGERLALLNSEETLIKTMIIDGIRLLHKKTHPIQVEEHMISFLLPGARGSYNREVIKEDAS